MKKKYDFRPKIRLKSKHMLAIMIIICISLLAATFSADFSYQPLQDSVGYLVVPFEKGINQLGDWLHDFTGNFRDIKKLAAENEKLHDQISTLKEENNRLAVGEEELSRLKKLYEIDDTYSDYDKVLAQVIAKEPGNWYSTFTIDKGTKDGIQKDMNVIAQGGLVGIVTHASSGWSTVQTIIDDGSNVSGMTIANSNTCIISGGLEQMDTGMIKFSQLLDDKGTVSVGENIVTSHISDKYLEGILIGTISSISRDANNLTCNGYLVPAADFRHLQEVFVITKLKETAKESADEK